MKKIIISILAMFFLFSCSKQENNIKLEANKCTKYDEVFLDKNTTISDIKNICDYDKNLVELILEEHDGEKIISVAKFYTLVKIDKNFGLEILNNLSNKGKDGEYYIYLAKISELDKLIFTKILKEEYLFSNDIIKNKYLINQTKKYSIPEGLSYDDLLSKEELIIGENKKLTGNCLEYFSLIAKLEPKDFTKLSMQIGFGNNGLYDLLESKSLEKQYYDFLKTILKGYLYNNPQQFNDIISFLDKKGQIDKDTLDFIKAVLLIESNKNNQQSMGYDKVSSQYLGSIDILRKYDKNFTNKIISNFYNTYSINGFFDDENQKQLFLQNFPKR